jgi:predicted ATPase/class 3 adenylate cyclase
MRPSGTVTFVFTDIEGSTARWERDRAAMQDAVRRHDALVRSAIERHGGFVFKTIGDAFCASFARPEDAVAALLDVQRALGSEDFSAVGGLRVRAALHSGTADERDNDYFGPVVNRVARLLAIAHGGQVLVSGTTAGLLHGTLPPDAALRDLGEHRLKDFAWPERVYQLSAPGLIEAFPALRSLDARPNNLPAPLTSFIGREAEVEEISALLAQGRLVTLVGAGGIGKTRTSLQVAANLLDGTADGAHFVEFAPISSGEYIPTTVAQALGLTLAADGDRVANLVRELKDKRALLVFDNCEHLVEEIARVVSALVRDCPHVKLLASSRQALGIAGEVTYRLASLSLPAATALFVERARAVDRQFALTDENAPDVAEICRRLDGIALAIELAAARIRVLSPRQLRERLDERFRVLTGGSRDVLPRQKTLRALIDWSHDLLDERERILFRRLGIFVNGFTLEAAAAVASGDALDELDVFDALASLVDKSLVLAEPAGNELRYRLLESTRVYAREKLAAAGELGALETRHLGYWRDFFAGAKAREAVDLHDLLATELEDVRAALDRAAEGLASVAGAELLDAIWATWGIIGLYSEGTARIQSLLALIGAQEFGLRARLSNALSVLAANSGRTAQAFEFVVQAVADARASGDPATLALVLASFSWNASRLGRFDEALAAVAEAEAIPGVPARMRLRVLEAKALVSGNAGDLASAAEALEQLRAEHRALGNLASELAMSVNLAEAEHERGRTERAIALSREALPRFRVERDRNGLVQMLGNLAGYCVSVGDLPGAGAAAREAIAEFSQREPGATFVSIAIEHLALALALGGDISRAAALAGYADRALQRQGYVREFTERTTYERLAALLRDRLAPEQLHARLAEGAALAPEAAIARALEETGHDKE